MKRAFTLFWLTVFLCANVSAQHHDGEDIVIGQYRTLDSRILGETRTALVHLPEGYASTNLSYPVVFFLYGDFVMTYFADAASTLERLNSFRLIPDVILVGVDNTDRYRDLRPLKPDGSAGGADAFTGYLNEELFPFISANYRTNGYRILAGPQAGACFGFFALTAHPDLFNAFILENSFDNPRVIDDFLMEKATRRFSADSTLNVFLYMQTAMKSPNYPFSLEQQSLIEQHTPIGFRYVFSASDNDHYLIDNGFRTGMLNLYEGYFLPDSVAIKGLNEVLSYYQKVSEVIGYTVTASDHNLHHAASLVSSTGNQEEAKKIYSYLLSLYPESLDGLFQMGRILAAEGKYDQAIDHFQAFLLIRPHEAIVKQMLERTKKMLEEQTN